MYNPIKELGQNFLADNTVIEQMVRSLEIAENDEIIEIGPGLGAVTEFIARETFSTNFKLYAVEIDQRFILKLEDMYSTKLHIQVVNDDILNFLPKFQPTTPNANVKVIGSLPFYITSPIIHAIIKMHSLPKTVVLLVQKEVAQKIVSKEPDNCYLSVFVQTFYNAQYVCDVPATSFKPAPTVDGAIIKFAANQTTMTPDLIEKYEGFLHKGFSNPRKMLNKAFSLQQLWDAEIDPALRAQAISTQKWLEFFRKVCL